MSKVDDVIADARAELGKPYVYGAEGPSSFDCSGLMQYIFAKVGITLPRVASAQQDAVTKVSSPMPGDLVFWGDPAYHVALYIGGGKVIAAPEPGDVVKVQDVWGSPTYGRVGGLGTASTSIVDSVTFGASSVVSSVVSDITSGVRNTMIKLVFAATGLGLVGFGLYRSVAPAAKRARSTIEDVML